MNSRTSAPGDRLFDVIIVGAGPAGIAAAGTLQDAGLRVVVLDKGTLAEAIRKWPIYMTFFSTALNVELPGFPLITANEKPTRQEYLQYLRRYALDKKLDVRAHHRVSRIVRTQDGSFEVTAADERDDSTVLLHGHYVVAATGAYDIPKLLNCPGEQLQKVSHYFSEVHPYAGSDVAVIGGRNGAAETALLLWRAGARVTLVHRGEKLLPLKYWLEPDLNNRIKEGEIRAIFGARVVEIRPRDLTVEYLNDGRRETIANDYVVAQTGYRPDTQLLLDAGVEVDPATNRPRFDPDTLETNVPGLYVAGVIAAGDISNEIFIENSRHHGELILNSVHRKSARNPGGV